MDMEIAHRPEDIGPLLLERRKRQGLTLKEVSELSGLAISSLSDIERGAVTPSVDSLFKICRSLQFSLWLEVEDPGATQSC